MIGQTRIRSRIKMKRIRNTATNNVYCRNPDCFLSPEPGQTDRLGGRLVRLLNPWSVQGYILCKIQGVGSGF